MSKKAKQPEKSKMPKRIRNQKKQEKVQRSRTN